jgi:sugar-specific transcriptional regulator TrmB
LSKERIMNVLRGLGLSQVDTQVYIFLAKQGPHKTGEIALALNLNEKKTHASLRDLQNKNIVEASINFPLEFQAVPFKEVIDLSIEVKKEQAKAMQQAKNELLSSWRKMTKEPNEKS